MRDRTARLVPALRAGIVICLAALPTLAAAGDTCNPHSTAEAWAESELRIVGVEVGIARCPTPYSAVRVGLSYYAYGRFLYTGLTGSLRLQAGKTFMPYVGIGALGGFASKDEPADTDGVDNDRDGLIDEPGEERTIEDSSVFLYPELGFMYVPRKSIGIGVTARKYYGREFDGAVIYGVGLTLRGFFPG